MVRSTRRTRRAAAEEDDLRAQELSNEAAAKTECQRKKTVFTKSMNALLCAIQENASKSQILEKKSSFEHAYDEHSTSLVTLFEIYAKRNDAAGQDRAADEIDATQKKYSEMNAQYAAFLAETKSSSSRSTSSGSVRSSRMYVRSEVNGDSASHRSSPRNEQFARASEEVPYMPPPPQWPPIADNLVDTRRDGVQTRNEQLDTQRTTPRSLPSRSNISVHSDVDKRREFPPSMNERAIHPDEGRLSYRFPPLAEQINNTEVAFQETDEGQKYRTVEPPVSIARAQVNKAIGDLDSLYEKRRSELSQQLDDITVQPTARKVDTPKIGTDMWRQLNRVSIPEFSGDKRAYPPWKAAFYTCVDAAPATAEYKLLQLRSYLKGEALKCIENLGHSAAAYEAAKARLERKFGGERRQITLRLEELENFRPMREGTAKEIDKFADMLDLLVINLRESDQADELNSASLYVKVLRKMTEEMVARYKRWVDENGGHESVEVIRQWINREAEYRTVAAETVRGLGYRHQLTGQTHHVHGKKYSKDKRDSKSDSSQPKDSCPVCNENHPVWKCSTFKSFEVSARWDAARKHKLCFRCLSSRHRGSDCKRSKPCEIDGCTRNHSRLLHEGEKQAKQEPVEEAEEPDEYSNTAVGEHQTAIALRTIPVVIRNGGKSVTVNALLDDGSTRTYVNSDIAAELELLTGVSEEITVGTMGGAQRTFQTEEVTFVLESLDGRTSRAISCFTAERVTGPLQAVEWRKIAPEWGHLKRLPFPKVGRKKTIDILIGLDQAELHAAVKEVCGKPGEPLARLTPLGWTCVGEIRKGLCDESVHTANLSYFVNGGVAEVNKTLQRFWEVEEPVGACELMSKDEQAAYDSVRESICRSPDDSNKYRVTMPWRADTSAIRSNYDAAKKRLVGTEKSLVKRNLSDTYKNIIQQHLAKGYIRKVCKDDKTGRWFLPHFAISRPDKSTTKTRIVFDASARSEGTCLNDYIHKGPKLQRDLNDVLMRFRKSPIAIACDVAEMYLQIELAPADRPFHRFLWRDMEDREPDQYEFNRLVFGVNSCPFQAQLVTRYHAETNAEQFPRAADAIINSTYMDDTMDSVCDVSAGLEMYAQLSELWGSAGMHARKWISNSKEVLQGIPEEDRATEINLEDGPLPIVKTLGVTWQAEEDVFSFTSNAPTTMSKHTKRSFLSSIASLFDPIGMIAPFIIRAKMMMQDVWLTGLDWDQTLPEELSKRIERWFEELNRVNQVRVPRCLSPNPDVVNTTLHLFCDASENAYATVCYLRTRTSDGNIHVRQVMAKSKVAPVKAVSIPRLELLGATLSTTIGPSIMEKLGVSKESVFYWSDSQNVLWWISSRSRILKTFVANRVAKIQEVSESSQWRYVATGDNPADLASRGMPIEELITSKLWWEGPLFLQMEQNEGWPKTIAVSKPSDNARKEVKKLDDSFMVQKMNFDAESRMTVERYSTKKRLVRVTAWIIRFANNCRIRAEDRSYGEISSEEFTDAETSLIVMMQHRVFTDEIRALKQQQPLSKASKLCGLQPFLDDDEVLRSNSRLQKADHLSYDTRFPIILPRKNHLTKLIIRSYHKRNGHAMGTNHTLAALSERFYVLRAREAIREVETECNACVRKKARSATQIMAPLPKSRVRLPLKAFGRVSVDYAGPFESIQGRSRKRAKRYLCLFTCFTSRAVHLEMAFSLDTDSFLNAFYRMTSRRGLPLEVTSDNGTNFTGGERELRELVQAIDTETITNSTADKGIKWTFNPPLGPHFGGVHEIMVKAAKRAIYSILRKADVNDEELISAFAGAEDLLNSRPITYQTAHPADDLPLTPNHFLQGRAGGEFAPSSVDTVDFSARKRWRRVQELVRHFWKRWLQEWLPSLARRSKWNAIRQNVKIDDLVLVIDPDLPRGQWSMGRIMEAYEGSDGHVRSVKLLTKGATYIRPITKICPLEFSHCVTPVA